jgi:hypothetical protein
VSAALAANADGKSPTSALPLTGIASGSLTGSTSGAYDYYTFNYPGDGSIATLAYSVAPNDPVTISVTGVNVYQNGTLLATNNAVGNPPGSSSVDFSSTTSGPILVQVYNYGPSLPANFQLQLNGVAGASASPTPAPAAPGPQGTPAATPAPAPAPLVGDGSAAKPFELKTSASGTLAGNVAGNYVNYSLPYAGDGSTQTINFTFSPNGPDTANGIFINVYQNGTTLSAVQGNDNGSNLPGNVMVQFSSTTAGPVVIQVGNYNPSGAINYTISH